MGLADAGWPSRITFSAFAIQVVVARCANTSRRSEGLVVDVEVLDGLHGGEVGSGDAEAGAVVVRDLPLQHRREVVLVRPSLVPGGDRELLPDPPDRRRLGMLKLWLTLGLL